MSINTDPAYLRNYMAKANDTWRPVVESFLTSLISIARNSDSIDLKTLKTDGVIIRTSNEDLALLQFRVKKLVIYGKEPGSLAKLCRGNLNKFGILQKGINKIWFYKWNAIEEQYLKSFADTIQNFKR